MNHQQPCPHCPQHSFPSGFFCCHKLPDILEIKENRKIPKIPPLKHKHAHIWEYSLSNIDYFHTVRILTPGLFGVLMFHLY